MERELGHLKPNDHGRFGPPQTIASSVGSGGVCISRQRHRLLFHADGDLAQLRKLLSIEAKRREVRGPIIMVLVFGLF